MDVTLKRRKAETTSAEVSGGVNSDKGFPARNWRKTRKKGAGPVPRQEKRCESNYSYRAAAI